MKELKSRGIYSYEPMHAWGVGGETVPPEVVRQMQEASNIKSQLDLYEIRHRTLNQRESFHICLTMLA